MVTSLKKVKWDNELIEDIVGSFEKLSTYIEGHSHTEKQTGSPPEPGDLQDMIPVVQDLIKRAKPDRKS